MKISSEKCNGNPVLPVHAADPHLCMFDGRYYLYATDAGVYQDAASFHGGTPGGGGAGFAAWSSPDLAEWEYEGQILSFTNVAWARSQAWAPAMIERGGRYFFYFCSNSQIGVAVGDSPIGPFRDPLGHPLIPFRPDLSAIDPMVFIDHDGQAYLHWGAVPGYWLEKDRVHLNLSLSVRPLADDMMTFSGPEVSTIAVRREPGEAWGNLHHIEAPFAFRRESRYYLMWSQGACMSSDTRDAYRVNYATSDSPLGPWEWACDNPVLDSQPDLGVYAPGHHSVLHLPWCDEWWCAYHANDGTARPGEHVDRRVWIDQMVFDEGGEIKTIVPTREGPASRPIPAPR